MLFPIPTGARGSSSTLLDRHTQVRLGCIDIGSNTTRLLVADCSGLGLTWVHEERAFTHIGHELQQTGRIGSAKIAGQSPGPGTVLPQLIHGGRAGEILVWSGQSEEGQSAGPGAWVARMPDREGHPVLLVFEEPTFRMLFVPAKDAEPAGD